MKHLLIIISFLLLSSPVIGQSSKYESVNQCVLQTMTEKKLTGNQMFEMVKEECERSMGSVGSRGKKREKGVLFLRDGNNGIGWYKSGNEENDYKYVGEIKNGEPNGQGTITYPSGSKYVGEVKDGFENGQGTKTWLKGIYKGQKYVGEWKNGRNHGQGTKTYSYERKYVGEWKDGFENGQGTETWFDKEYVGEYKDGSFHGQGIFTVLKGLTDDWNGKKYVGEWKNGLWWNIIHYDNEGNIEYKIVNGVKQ